MAVRFTIDKLEDVEAGLREHYVAENGKFYLATQGDHPKVAEFREKNITLLRDLARFDGIDPEAVRVDRLKLTELEKAKPDGRVATLEAELVAEQAARAEAQKKVNRGVLRDTFRAKALAAGVLPAALDICLDKAEPIFTVVNETVQARPNTFSKSRPGELLTPDEWIVESTKEFPFLFGRSAGGGADPKPGGGCANVRELRDPTPQQLGEHASAIAKGDVKVRYSS